MPDPAFAPTPQIDLDSAGSIAQTSTRESTLGEVASADVTGALQTSQITNAISAGTEMLQNAGPVRYQNAGQYIEDNLAILSDPALAQSSLENNQLLSPEEANTNYWQPGMQKFSTPIRAQAAETMSSHQQQINATQDTVARANLGFAGGAVNNFATSALQLADPTQDAMYFIPGVGEEKLYANIAGTLGKSFLAKTAVAAIRTTGEMTRGSLEQNITDAALNAPLGQQKDFATYAEDDLTNIASATALGLGLKGLGKAFGKGVSAFTKLDNATQDHLSNAVSSESPAPINTVLDLDKVVCEKEAQLGGAKLPLEERMELLTNPDAPKSADEVRLDNSNELTQYNNYEDAAKTGNPAAAASLVQRSLGASEEVQRPELQDGDTLHAASEDAQHQAVVDAYRKTTTDLGKDLPGSGLPDDALPLQQGSEHDVHYSEADGRVYKVLKTPEDFGIDPEAKRATPVSYLNRLDLQNKEFGMDNKWEGVNEYGQTIHSQPFIKGTEPTVQEVHDYMRSKGYAPKEHVGATRLLSGIFFPDASKNITDWQKGNIKVSDAETFNFIKDESGKVRPIDLAMSGEPAPRLDPHQIEAQGAQLQQQRALEVKQAHDNGTLGEPVPAKTPIVEPVLSPSPELKEQVELNNKLLGEVEGAHADLIKQLEGDPEKNASQIDQLKEGMEEADEEINRVAKQKSFVQQAVNCALDHGL